MNNDSGTQAILSAVRSILIAFGAFLTTKGLASSEMVNEGIGAAMVIIPAVWGVVQKYQSEHNTKVRETVAVQSGVAAVQQGEAVATPALIAPAHAQAIIADFAPIVAKP